MEQHHQSQLPHSSVETLKFHPIWGIGELIQGILFLKNHKSLWKYCWIPMLITGVLSIPTFFFFGDLFHFIREFLPTWSPVADIVDESFFKDLWDSIAHLGATIFSFFFDAIVFIVTALTLLLSILLFLKILSSPFNDALSEKVELLLEGDDKTEVPIPPFVASVLIAVRTEGQRLILFLVLFIPANIAAWFIPGIGHTILSIALAMYSAYWLCYDSMSYSMDRRLWKLLPRLRFLIKHPLRNLCFGFGIYLLAFIPLLNLILMPAFVVGGTLLFKKEKKATKDP